MFLEKEWLKHLACNLHRLNRLPPMRNIDEALAHHIANNLLMMARNHQPLMI
jgi:hypothetical protein